MATPPEYKRRWRWTWAIWLGIVALSFAILEGVGLAKRKTGDTLSESTRHWLGIVKGGRLGKKAIAFAAALVLFLIWFIPHILFQIW